MKEEDYICDICGKKVKVEKQTHYPKEMNQIEVKINFQIDTSYFDVCDSCLAKYKGPSFLDKMLTLMFGKKK